MTTSPNTKHRNIVHVATSATKRYTRPFASKSLLVAAITTSTLGQVMNNIYLKCLGGVIILLALKACGQTGPLRLPEASATPTVQANEHSEGKESEEIEESEKSHVENNE